MYPPFRLNQIDKFWWFVMRRLKNFSVLSAQRLAIDKLAHVRRMDAPEGFLDSLIIEDLGVEAEENRNVLEGLRFQIGQRHPFDLCTLHHVDEVTELLQEVRHGLSDLSDLFADQCAAQFGGLAGTEGLLELADQIVRGRLILRQIEGLVHWIPFRMYCCKR